MRWKRAAMQMEVSRSSEVTVSLGLRSTILQASIFHTDKRTTSRPILSSFRELYCIKYVANDIHLNDLRVRNMRQWNWTCCIAVSLWTDRSRQQASVSQTYMYDAERHIATAMTSVRPSVIDIHNRSSSNGLCVVQGLVNRANVALSQQQFSSVQMRWDGMGWDTREPSSG